MTISWNLICLNELIIWALLNDFIQCLQTMFEITICRAKQKKNCAVSIFCRLNFLSTNVIEKFAPSFPRCISQLCFNEIMYIYSCKFDREFTKQNTRLITYDKTQRVLPRFILLRKFLFHFQHFFCARPP